MNLFPADHETIEGIGRAVRDERRSYVEVVEGCLAQVEEWEPRVRAWAFLDREGAIIQARERDRELREGVDRGPIHGIPFGIKDIADVAGMPTGLGIGPGTPAERDAEIVGRLRKAGAVILGKTVTTPHAWVDPPATRNPWDLDRTPGGSSSGSAAAVATGMCLGALGTQTGGSLTRPAAFCGVASFKLADGFLVSRGIAPLAPSLDTPGFMARTVADLELIWDGLMKNGNPIFPGPRSRSASRASREVAAWNVGRRGLFYAPHVEPDPKPIEYRPGDPPILGRVRGFFQDLMEPSARVIHEAALLDLAEAGAKLVEADLPETFGDIHRPHRIVMAAEAASAHSSRMSQYPEEYPPRIAALVDEGRGISALDYIQALDLRQSLREAVDRSISGANALVTPAALGPAPDPSTTGDASFNSPWNFTQLPTISFPIGQSSDGLPLALQIVGHRFGLPFDVARWCEHVIRNRHAQRHGP